MNSPDPHAALIGAIADVQAYHDERNIPIGRVGVRGLRYPLNWRGEQGVQPAVGEFTMAVALPADQKGTHMSRFIALLEERDQRGESIDVAGLVALHREMLGRLEAESGRIEVSLPIFIRKAAPISGIKSLIDYRLSVVIDGSIDSAQARVGVTVPVTSLCPCSKEISEYGAHNQRSHVTIEVLGREPIAPESLIRVAEAQASCDLYGVLKRVDEKFVTERAYDNPKFVEDLIRDVAAALSTDARIERYSVEVENFESIHNHSAYARIDSR
jgi:GTP cyclohydrolase I